MSKLNRRDLLQAGASLAIPLVGLPLVCGCQPAKKQASNEGSPQDDETSNAANQEPNKKETSGDKMQIHYLEIVTEESEALCKQYEAIHGVTFSDPDPMLGSARIAKFGNGSSLAIRGPMREGEAPVIRPYTLVENLKEAVAAAAEAGAEVALPEMEIPGHGTIAIVIQGGIECGFWQSQA